VNAAPSWSAPAPAIPVQIVSQRREYVTNSIQGPPLDYTHNLCPHFKCYWCNKETWGVNRKVVGVYSAKENKIIMVNVHDECQAEREKQIARVLFSSIQKNK